MISRLWHAVQHFDGSARCRFLFETALFAFHDGTFAIACCSCRCSLTPRGLYDRDSLSMPLRGEFACLQPALRIALN